MTDTPTPAVGQTWEDNDPRGHGRRIVVINIEATHALVFDGKRNSRIRLDRFRPTSTGYRYVGGGDQ